MARRIWRLTLERPVALRTVTLLILLTAAAAWLWAHEGHEALPTKGATPVKDKAGAVIGVNLSLESRKALEVQVADVIAVTLDDQLAAPAAVVVPWDRHALVTTRLAGKVKALRVRPGEAVARGQVIAEVESLGLVDLQRDLVDARNEADLSAKNLAELEEGGRIGSISAKEVLDARALHRQNLDALDVSRRKLLGLGVRADVLEKLLRDRDARPFSALPVTAPFAGVAVHVDVDLGQVVEPGDHLMEVTDLSRVWVKIGVLEKDLHRVQKGQSVELRFPAAPDEGSWSTTVAVKGQSLEPQTVWGTVWADLDNPGGLLLPGMAGQALIRLPAARQGLLVPASALVREGAERFVLVEIAPGQYRRQNVVVEEERGDQVQVSRSTGLFPGDRVVTTGSHELASFFAQGVLRLSPEAERGIGLVMKPVGQQPVAETFTFNAVVDLPPSARAVASARLAGTLQRVVVGRDSEVQAGAILAEVFSPELMDLQLDLLRSVTQTRLLEDTVKRLRPTARSGVTPQRTLRETETALAAVRRRADALRHKLLDVGLHADDLRALIEERKLVEAVPVRAPIAGTVIRFQATLGQAIKAESPLFEIHDLSKAMLRVHVPERQLPEVRVGQTGRVRLEADSGFVGRAAVVRRGQSSAAGSRVVPVWADVEDRPRTVLPGMTARLTLLLAEPTPTLAVPVDALLRDGASAYVFVQRKDGAFERRAVTTGRSDDQFMEITHGLFEGDMVAVRGVADLQTAYAAIQ
jgi:RND family efflux transporter MFP subunit